MTKAAVGRSSWLGPPGAYVFGSRGHWTKPPSPVLGEFDAEILDGIERGFFDEEKLRKRAEERGEAFKIGDDQGSLQAAWDLYHGSNCRSLASSCWVFLVLHAYVLLHFALLADKVGVFHSELQAQIKDEDTRTRLRRQLPSNIFVQYLAGPSEVRTSVMGFMLRLIALITLVIFPIALLVFFQLQFLPYHDAPITWWLRIAVLLDILLLWTLWPSIARGHASWISWHDFRRPRIIAANLQGANLQQAQLQGANLNNAELQGANLRDTEFQGADLSWAKLQGADLSGAKLQGADLRGAELQGAELEYAGVWLATVPDLELKSRGVAALEMSSLTAEDKANLIERLQAEVTDAELLKTLLDTLNPILRADPETWKHEDYWSRIKQSHEPHP